MPNLPVDSPENPSPVADPVRFGQSKARAARISQPAASKSKPLASSFGLSPNAIAIQYRCVRGCRGRIRLCVLTYLDDYPIVGIIIRVFIELILLNIYRYFQQ